MKNLDAVVRFCCRAAGSPGTKQFGAPLADPYATPDMAWAPEVTDPLSLPLYSCHDFCIPCAALINLFTNPLPDLWQCSVYRSLG